ncbi:hypothetical protein PanWU01x14_008300 [Parasponia andersonii]|uniref:Uncharacterized protein n=1 Tax=Parasponia andersonii TaxID=3476 RepID=A0A2P5E251_PARAD|nr:hypothetical protein PanWU01x14_008300 [Parasponia andersonii]
MGFHVVEAELEFDQGKKMACFITVFLLPSSIGGFWLCLVARFASHILEETYSVNTFCQMLLEQVEIAHQVLYFAEFSCWSSPSGSGMDDRKACLRFGRHLQ